MADFDKYRTSKTSFFFEQRIFNSCKNNPLFGSFKGAFFRSTLNINEKLELLNNFLELDTNNELKNIIETLNANYDVSKISTRNKSLTKLFL